MALNEAFNNKIADKGTIKFAETKIDDPHIKKILNKLSADTGLKEQDIIDRIHKKVASFNDIAKDAPLLYATIQRNIVENEIFHTVEEAHKKGYQIGGGPTFDVTTFNELMTFIKANHAQFFPLRNFIDHKSLWTPIIIFVPSIHKSEAHFNNIPTAAATPKGQFIFNKVFMQNLLDFAHFKGVKPKGRRYKCNGGTIPDEYAYIEFLIIHEFMHYTYADFYYAKILKVKTKKGHKVINWVGDFRTNYLLVKSGYEQLPMGLFNDDINYDRQNSYKEMFDLVTAEFDKLTAAQQAKVGGAIGGIQGGAHNTPKPPKGGTPPPGKPPLQPGGLVKNPNGKLRIVDKIDQNGKVTVRELTVDEKKKVEDSYKDHGVLGIPKDIKDGLK